MRKPLALLVVSVAVVVAPVHAVAAVPRCAAGTDPHADICVIAGHPGHCMWMRTVTTQQPGQPPVTHHRGERVSCDM